MEPTAIITLYFHCFNGNCGALVYQSNRNTTDFLTPSTNLKSTMQTVVYMYEWGGGGGGGSGGWSEKHFPTPLANSTASLKMSGISECRSKISVERGVVKIIKKINLTHIQREGKEGGRREGERGGRGREAEGRGEGEGREVERG